MHGIIEVMKDKHLDEIDDNFEASRIEMDGKKSLKSPF